MAPIPPSSKLTSAILSSVSRGTYPEDDSIASAELPSDAFPALLSALESAREEVRSDIRQLSRDSADDVSGWIEQAAALQADIEKSKAVARDIVAEAEAGRVLEESVHDASAKVELLRKELNFNETLAGTLEKVKGVETEVDKSQDSLKNGALIEALEGLEQAEQDLEHLREGGFGDARVVGLLAGRMESLKKEIEIEAVECWDRMLTVDPERREVVLRQKVQRTKVVELDTIVKALTKLKILDLHVERFAREFGALTILPRLQLASDKTFAEIEATDPGVLKSRPGADDREASGAINSVFTVVQFLEGELPAQIAHTVFSKLAHSIVMRLTLGWLEPAMPMAVSEQVHDFEDLVAQVAKLADKLEELGWSGADELRGWIKRVPMTWLQRRRETSLAAVRSICARGIKDKHIVERVETEVLSNSDVMIAGAGTDAGAVKSDGGDDWDASWDDDEKDEDKAASKSEPAAPEEDDADAGAWGFDDDPADPDEPTDGQATNEEKADDDDEGDAWGWGDDENDDKSASPVESKLAPKSNGQQFQQQQGPQEITLRENYTVTSVPDAILEAISHLVDDAEKLADESFSSSQLSAASAGLYAIPTLILAMYRATANAYYDHEVAGKMLIYNDTFRLTESIQSFIKSLSEKPTQSAKRLRLDADIKSLTAFGKRSYSREMESQRTILHDLLDGAQGFTSVAAEPFKSAAESAVQITTDRIRDVARDWTPILSRSALLQSLGSLLSNVLNKLIIDIEDLSDISEDESTQLKRFCDVFDGLKDLFVQERSGPDGDTVKADMTSVYAPIWFKFQYLAEILDSSLADIKFLWTESELHLEFEADEVVDLITALFAESDYRRKAIADIRRGPPRT